MDIRQTRTESIQEEIKPKMGIHEEKMESAIQSIQSKLEETIKLQVEDGLPCVSRRSQGLCN
jgi:hypothetical protein